ncbi:MAG: hypothetical protein IT374_09930 [Polyangiaceae bacterium]|nr:hypothetical protein [Polyangiaceae bacterium]
MNRGRALVFLVIGLAAACSAATSKSQFDDPAAQAGASGSAQAGQSGGSTSTGGSTQAGGAQTGGFQSTGGGGQGGDAGGTLVDGGGLQDATPDVGGDSGCVVGTPPGPGPIAHTCKPDTKNECDGTADSNPSIPNGKTGNGFDDDCDGQVDEGCECDDAHPPGTTRDCYLVPASQVDASTSLPVGWCKENAKGTVACLSTGGGEFGTRVWDGYCKGAQQPFADDACGLGDFDCDGKDQNPKSQDCSCQEITVTCPTEPVVISPFPYADDLEKKKPNPFDPKPNEPFIVDGWQWISNNQGVKATNWKWTVTGGDCDNILPHTTFGIYNGKNTTTTAKRKGTEVNNLGSNGKQKGIVLGPINDAHQIWPAFSLSGDYVIQGEFDIDGKHHSCTMQVRVRAPGVRAEMCWDMGASVAALGLTTTDVDLHFARLQGTTCAGKHGWFDSCGDAPKSDDCNYTCASGCRTGNKSFCLGEPAPPPGWGYPPSKAESCHGWGSLREPAQSCDNPRLDADNLGCNVNKFDPVAGGLPGQGFCGPENINLDNPNVGDRFLVGVHYYGGDTEVHPHVNLYCNGERKLSVGYDPTANPPATFPRLKKSFGEVAKYWDGDFWEVATVKWTGGADPCAIEPVKSKTPKPDQDGSTSLCVDTNQMNKANSTASDRWLFTPGGNVPATAADACWH